MPQLVDTQLAHGDLATMVVDVDHANGMGIGLVAADVEGATRIACHRGRVGDGFHGHGVFRVSQGLWLVDMAKGEVVVARAERSEALGLERANLEVVSRDVGSCHGEVSHHDNGAAVCVALGHAVEHRL